MGDYFEVQLEALDKVGSELLPNGADAFFGARARLEGAETTFEGELFDNVNHKVNDVRDQFADVFDGVGKDLRLAAEAVLEIAQRYRDADNQGTDTPSVPSPSPQPGPGKKSPGHGSISLDDDLNHLADLLGQLAPETTTMEDVANVAVTIWQPWVGLPMGGAPVTEGHSHMTGEAVRPYPVDKLRAAFCPSAAGSADPAEELKADIDAARLALTEDFEATVGSVKDSMTEWSGDAAENFKTYIANVVDAKDQQHLALDAAWAVMDMYSQVITAAHDDVKALLAESISKAEAALQTERKAQIDGVVTAVATVITGGLSGSATSIISWAATGIASQALKSEYSTREEVPGAVIEAANALQDAIADRVDECKEQLTALLEILGGGELTDNMTEIRPEQPLILNAPSFDPEEFGLPDDQEPAGVEDNVDTSSLAWTDDLPDRANDPEKVG